MKALNKITHKTRYETQRDVLTACQDCDLMIVHPLLLYNAITLSEKLNKPLMLATPFPYAPATKQFPQIFVSAKRLPFKFLNKLTHLIFAKVSNKGSVVDMNEWRSKLGLLPLRGLLMKHLVDQRIPILHAYSPSLVPHPKDWGEHNFITGQWKLDDKHLSEPIKIKLDDELEQWLARGQAPIYFGFGSLPVLEPQKMIDMVIDITKSLDTRAIIASGWSNITSNGEPLPEAIFMTQSANHELLFPRCSYVVHHGGAGTTHTTLESGTPSIICSTYADQPFWGERISELKVGRHIPFPTLTKENLIQAIHDLNHQSVRKHAEELGKRIKAENGLQSALDWIEKQLPNAPVYKN